MTIKFKDDINEQVVSAREEYFESLRNNESDEVVEAKYGEYMSTYSEALKEDILTQASQQAAEISEDKSILMNRGLNVLTAEETKFFRNLADGNPDFDVYKEDLILPETTVLRVFEDMKENRPLLGKINFKLAGVKTRMILSDPEGAAMWGEIFGEIQGQVKAHFSEVTFSQNKLTAFAIIPKDMLELGPDWIERFVRLQLTEAMATQLEYGVVKGAGPAKNQPVGLLKDFDLKSGDISDKESSGTLTFQDARTTAVEMAQIMTALSTKENGKPINISGKVTFIVNPSDQFLVKSQYTIQTLNGNWVTSLPFNVDVVASTHVDSGKLVAMVGERYHAMQTGAMNIKKYDQTFALQDADLYITKQFAHGIPEDKKTALLYDLDIEDFRKNGAETSKSNKSTEEVETL
ncbi:phage major capsid protein [Staphylococcus xylosus]